MSLCERPRPLVSPRAELAHTLQQVCTCVYHSSHPATHRVIPTAYLRDQEPVGGVPAGGCTVSAPTAPCAHAALRAPPGLLGARRLAGHAAAAGGHPTSLPPRLGGAREDAPPNVAHRVAEVQALQPAEHLPPQRPRRGRLNRPEHPPCGRPPRLKSLRTCSFTHSLSDWSLSGLTEESHTNSSSPGELLTESWDRNPRRNPRFPHIDLCGTVTVIAQRGSHDSGPYPGKDLELSLSLSSLISGASQRSPVLDPPGDFCFRWHPEQRLPRGLGSRRPGGGRSTVCGAREAAEWVLLYSSITGSASRPRRPH